MVTERYANFDSYIKLYDMNNRDAEIDGIAVHYIELSPEITIAKQLENLDPVSVTINIPADAPEYQSTTLTNTEGTSVINEQTQTIVDTKYKSSFIKWFDIGNTDRHDYHYIFTSDFARTISQKSIDVNITSDNGDEYNYDGRSDVYGKIVGTLDGKETVMIADVNLNMFLLQNDGYIFNAVDVQKLSATNAKLSVNVDYEITYTDYMVM